VFQFIWCVVAVFAYVLGFFSRYPTDGYHGDISPIFEILFFSLVWPVFIVIAEAADYFIGGRKYDWLIAVPVMVALCLVILLGMRPSDADKYRAFQSHAIDWGLGCFFGVYAIRRVFRQGYRWLEARPQQ
jgi:ABC-type uncharacterized transport system permease subunit